MFVQAIGIVAIAAIGRTSRRLRIRHAIRLGAKYAQEGLRRHGSRADFDVIRLLQHTSALRPEGLEAQDEFLECGCSGHVCDEITNLADWQSAFSQSQGSGPYVARSRRPLRRSTAGVYLSSSKELTKRLVSALESILF